MIDKVERFKQVAEQMTEIYRKKNHDYGDSFSKSVKEFGPVAGLVRISDKFNRIKNLIFDNERLIDDESVQDTLIDLASYCIMLAIENNEE